MTSIGTRELPSGKLAAWMMGGPVPGLKYLFTCMKKDEHINLLPILHAARLTYLSITILATSITNLVMTRRNNIMP